MARIQTTYGEMDESALVKVEGPGWVEYYLHGELVHRSASAELTSVAADAAAGRFA